MVLHTWSQTLTEHIHVHCIVTGGALQQTKDGPRWCASARDFLFPILSLSRDFRERFCAGLRRLHRRRRLRLVGEASGLDVEGLVQQMRSKRWEVFAKPAPSDPTSLCEYLGKYTYRIAISNHRIVSIARGRVRFTYHDNRDGGQEKVMELPALEFMRRFLLHVLPTRFVRVRHYGLHHSSRRGALEQCRALLGQPKALPEAPKLVLSEWLESILGVDPRLCPFCGEGRMFVRSEFEPVSPLRWAVLSFLGLPTRGEAPT
jgi:hypothetical protein